MPKSTVSPFFLLLLLAFLPSQAAQKPCGFMSILSEVRQLDQSSYILSREDLVSKENGQKMTVFGWLKLEDESPRVQSLIKIAMVPNNPSASSPATFSDFMRLSYDYSDPKAPKLLFAHAFDASTFKKEVFNTLLPLNTWLSFVYSFDMANDSAYISIGGREENSGKEVSFLGEVTTKFRNFVIPQKFEISVGCFPSAQGASLKAEDKKLCMRGKVMRLGMIMEYFKNPKLSYLLDSGNKGSLAEFRMSLQRVLDPAQSQIVDASGTQKLVPEQLSMNGTSTQVLSFSGKDLFQSNDFLSAYTIYSEVEFLDSLEDNVVLFGQKSGANSTQLHFEVRLVKDQTKSGGRFVRVTFPAFKNLSLETKPALTADSKHVIAIALSVYAGKNLAVLLRTDDQTVAVEGIAENFLSTSDIFVRQNFDESLKVTTFGVVPNASGLSLNFISDKNQAEGSSCLSTCKLFAQLSYGEKFCSVCLPAYVRANGACDVHCPRGFYGRTGSCIKCKDPACSELSLNRFASIRRTGPLSFEVSASPHLVNFAGNFNDLLAVSIAEAASKDEYSVVQSKNANGYSLAYTFAAPKIASPTFKFEAPEATPVYDFSRTLVQGKAVEVPFKSDGFTLDFDNDTFDQFGEPDLFPGTVINKRVEMALEKLSIAAFAIFLFGMLVGLIFVVWGKFAAISSHFIYVKLVQAFLVFYYIVFWGLYNSQLARNLQSFLSGLFKYSVGFHNIFYKAAKELSNKPSSKAPFKKFEQANAGFSFLLNFGLIFVIQGAVIVVYACLKIISVIKKRSNKQAPYQIVDEIQETNYNEVCQNQKNSSAVKIQASSYLSKIIKAFEFKILWSVFLLFATECTAFALYNLIGRTFDSAVWRFSFAWSLVYFALTFGLILLSLTLSFFPGVFLKNQARLQQFAFLFEGFKPTFVGRSFQALQYLHYALFAVALVAGFPQRLDQIIPALFLLILLTALCVFRTPTERFDKIEQLVLHSALLVAKVFLAAIVIDDSARLMSGAQRWVLGWVVLLIAFIVICWNTTVICLKSFLYFRTWNRMRSDLLFSTSYPQLADQQAIKCSNATPQPMPVDFELSNRALGTGQGESFAFISPKVGLTESSAPHHLPSQRGSKKTLKLNQFIESDDQAKLRGQPEVLTFATSNNYLVNAKSMAVNQGNNIMQSAPIGQGLARSEFRPSEVAKPLSEKNVTDHYMPLESQVQPLHAPQQVYSIRETNGDQRMPSHMNMVSGRSHLEKSQQGEIGFSMLNSFTSDKFQSLQPMSVLEKGANQQQFGKRKESVVNEVGLNKNGVIIEESNVEETLNENSELKETAFQYFSKESGNDFNR